MNNNYPFFVSVQDDCLFQGKQETIEKLYKQEFKIVSVSLFQVKIENVVSLLAWRIQSEKGIFFYPVFIEDVFLFNGRGIFPIKEVTDGSYFVYGSSFFKFADGCIMKCVIFGSQEIITAYALACGIVPSNVRLAKAVHLNKILALEWIFDDEENGREFYFLVFPDELSNLKHADGGICGPLEFGYQEFSCGEAYRHNDEIWYSKLNDRGLIELVRSPLSIVKS